MNYTELKAGIADTTENTFSDDDYARFATYAEQTIYNAIQFPAIRKNQTGALTSGNSYLTVPSDFLFPYSLAVEDADGNYHYLLQKDVSFIREAYPDSGSGLPAHYAVFDKDSFIVGPKPDDNYTVELHYGIYPESIVTAGTTWLSENYEALLLAACLVEAARFMKEEPDVIKMYEDRYAESLKLAKLLGDGKLKQDSYRNGQARVNVR